MRVFIFSILILFISCKEKASYSSLTKEQASTEFQLKSINPNDDKIEYWEINYINLLTPETIYFTGDKEVEPSLEEREKIGFFQGCHPMHCAYNIIYLKNDKWHLITSERDLRNFIGEVDNEFEAFLIAKIDNFSIDNHNEKGNGFYKSDKDYFLKVMKYKSCPESKESFLLKVTLDAEIESHKSLGYYYKSSDRITY